MGHGGGAVPSLTAPASLAEITALRVSNQRLAERCQAECARADSACAVLPNVQSVVSDAKSQCAALSERLRAVTLAKGEQPE
jgi:hypothetical protein